jgi:predicted RNA methylase
LFVAEPGLAPLLLKELVHKRIVAPRTRASRLNLRNYDLLVVPDVQVVGDPRLSRLASHTLRCPVFGRNHISDRQFAALETAFRAEKANKLVATVAGSVFQRQELLRWIGKRLGERGVHMNPATEERPMWLFAVDAAYYMGFPRQNYHDAPGRSRDADRSGSLPPTIAAAMVFAAVPAGSEVIWDPVMGSGTLLREAAAMLPDAALYGSDADPDAVALARRLLPRQQRIWLGVGPAGSVDLPCQNVTLTLANPPWGHQFAAESGQPAMLRDILRSSLRHAAPRWRACILTPHDAALHAAARESGLQAVRIARTSVRGLAAGIWQVTRTGAAEPAG